VSPDPSKYREPLSPVLSDVTTGFSENNLTGYEFVPRSDIFIPRSSLWWTADIKIPISPMETLVKDFFLMTQVYRIIEIPEYDQTVYLSNGILTIGDSKWNVNAGYNKANDNSAAELRVFSYCDGECGIPLS